MGEGVRIAWLACALAGCATEQQCQDYLSTARTQALADTPGCAWGPDDLERSDCQRFDERPRRAYVGAFCSTATLDCLESDVEIVDACFGRPSEF